MKKRVVILSLTFISVLSINAQLKVKADGSVWQGYSGYPNLWLGTYPSGGYDNGHWGIEVLNGGLNFWKPWPSPNSGNYMLYLAQNGNVGIGKVPSAKLDVAGSIAIYGTVRLSSDERLKTNIVKLSMAETNRLYDLNAKSYQKHQPEEVSETDKKFKAGNENLAKNFEKQKTKQKEISEYGFLAQELKEVYPNLVSQDSSGYYLVDYIGLIPIMVESLKEQKVQIEAQNKKIETLKELVGKLLAGSKK